MSRGRRLIGVAKFLCVVFCCYFFSSNQVFAECSASLVAGGTISINISNKVGIATDNITVNTDCNGGYTLSINGPSDNNLYHNGDSDEADLGYIRPSSGAFDNPTTILGDNDENINTWGLSLTPNTTTTSGSFFGISSEKVTLAHKDGPSAQEGDTITVYYGASVGNGLPAGDYKMADNGKVVYSLVATNIENALITFDSNGGTIPSGADWIGNGNIATKEVALDGKYGALPSPVKEGYSFLGWSTLPREYQAVEYIESDGNQYIDTGVIPSNTTGAYAKVASKDVSTDSVYFGSRNSTNANSRFWVANTSGIVYFGWNTNTDDTKQSYVNRVNLVKLNFLNDRKIAINDTMLKDIGSEGLNQNPMSIYIFAANNGAPNWHSKIKLYEMKLSDGDTVIHHYIPCYRKSDGVIGLYDTYTGSFLLNQGTGAFGKGNDLTESYDVVDEDSYLVRKEAHTLFATWAKNLMISFDANGGTVDQATKEYQYNSYYTGLPTPTKEGHRFLGWSLDKMPDGYQSVEYVGANKGPYVMTEIIPTNTTGVYARLSSGDIYADSLYFGSRNSNTSNRFWAGNVSGKYYVGWNASTSSGARPYISENAVYDIYINYLNDRLATIESASTNYKVLHDPLGTLASSSEYIAIFGANYSNSSVQYRAHVNFYELVFSEGNNITHNFIPCYRRADEEAGFCDSADGRFYGNQGDGAIYKGDDVSSYVTSSDRLVKNENHTLYAIWE